MPAPKHFGAFQRAFDLLEKAAASRKGILYKTPTRTAARLRSECESIRNNFRVESREIYDRSHPLFGKTPYDNLVFDVTDEGLFIKKWEAEISDPILMKVCIAVLESKEPRAVTFSSEAAAEAFRQRFYAVRRRERRTAGPGSEANPVTGRSRLDEISLRKEGTAIIIECGLYDPENIQELE